MRARIQWQDWAVLPDARMIHRVIQRVQGWFACYVRVSHRCRAPVYRLSYIACGWGGWCILFSYLATPVLVVGKPPMVVDAVQGAPSTQ